MSFFNYLLTLQYKGTHYSGWQIQKQNERTIQGELNKALEKVSKSNEVKSLASGRTDAGVHAFGQVCHIQIPLEIPPKNLVKAINTHLPFDIRVVDALNSTPDFHPIRDSLWKEYQYFFSNTAPGVIGQELIAHLPYKMDFNLMEEASLAFIGKHDFCNFFCTGTEVSSTIREVFECQLTRHKEETQLWSQVVGEYFCFRVKGSGFLKQMVRLMMGAIWEVGKGKVSLEQLNLALQKPLEKKLGPVAPACGLYLHEVKYPS